MEVIEQLIATAHRLDADPDPQRFASSDPVFSSILDQIRSDSESGLFALWGTSTTVDANVGGPVLDDRVLAVLGSAAGMSTSRAKVNAGLIHTYGYLLAPVLTPFGYKRDRWCLGQVSGPVGLDWSAFDPLDTRNGTLLSRVTELASKIIAADGGTLDGVRPVPDRSTAPDHLLPGVSIRLSRTETADHVVTPNGPVNLSEPLTIRTRFAGRSDDRTVLLYTIDRGAGEMLITLFGVDRRFIERSRRPADRFRLRFNAVVDGLPGTELHGTCYVV